MFSKIKMMRSAGLNLFEMKMLSSLNFKIDVSIVKMLFLKKKRQNWKYYYDKNRYFNLFLKFKNFYIQNHKIHLLKHI